MISAETSSLIHEVAPSPAPPPHIKRASWMQFVRCMLNPVFKNVLLLCEYLCGIHNFSSSTVHVEKQTQMNSRVRALKFYDAASEDKSQARPELHHTTIGADHHLISFHHMF